MRKKSSYATSGHENILKEEIDDFSFGPDFSKEPIFADIYWEGEGSAKCPACGNDTVRILRDDNSVRLDAMGYCIKKDCRRVIVFKEVRQVGKRGNKRAKKRIIHGNPKKSRRLDTLHLDIIQERKRKENKRGENEEEIFEELKTA